MNAWPSIDRDPETAAERQERRDVLLAQSRELAGWDIRLTCACGQPFSLAITGYRCRCCGIVFCPACALRHFDLVADGANVRRREEGMPSAAAPVSGRPSYACELAGGG